MSIGNLKTLLEYKQVCENINPVYANIIFSYLTEIRKCYYYDSDIITTETPIINIGSKDGKIHGIYKWYFMSGALGTELSYINNKKHGIEKGYNPSGEIKRETPYVNGEIHGIQKNYYKSGEIKKEYFYENGKLIY
jgi:antitoxin component YwqK of YwqJK toxin-antitoxin module